MSLTPWDLILDNDLDGASNMAIDAALLDEVEQSTKPRSIVRLYRWKRPTISLGRNQKIDSAVDTSFCHEHGVDIVHRPTGGRAVLHDDELTYCVASNDSVCFGDTIYANYKSVSEALCEGFNRLGIPAVLAPETRRVPTAINGVVTIGITIVQEPMRKRVTEVRPRFLQEYVLNICRNPFAEYSVQFSTHLLEQR